MSAQERLRVLMVCAQCDGEDVGESWCSYQLVSRLARKCDVTVLTQRFPGHTAPSAQLTNAEVIEWRAYPYLSSLPRINSRVKPWYPLFYWRARKWIKQALLRSPKFDLVHHLTPMAMRYPSPCAGLNAPYIIGPVAGSLPTPDGFKNELGTEPAYARLRNLDGFRLRNDPWMRRTYESADLVICSSSYAATRLEHLNVRRIALETEVGVADVVERRAVQNQQPGKLRMLHVGRVVRTKGLRDAIRALAELTDLPDVTLAIAGDGEDLASCRAEAEQLGVAARLRFLGRQTRTQVEEHYRNSDLLLFPSFREPTGIVLFEAMRHGLPIITTDIGGPGYVVTDACGIRVPATNPNQFSHELANAIRNLATNPSLMRALSIGAQSRVEEIGLWDKKIQRIIRLYHEVRTGAQSPNSDSRLVSSSIGAL